MAMSKEHKEALARGRREASAIKAYLNAIQARGQTRSPSKTTLEKRLQLAIEKIEAEDDPLKQIELIQTRLDIEKALSKAGDEANIEQLESDFVEHAASYGERKGITYTAWREYGVPAKVLRSARIPETRRR